MFRSFPKTRYQGSKLKMLPFLKDIFLQLEFKTALDAFCGTCSVAYLMKSLNKQVFANDILKFNSYIAKALIENNNILIDKKTLESIVSVKKINYKNKIANIFSDIYYLDDENRWLDIVAQNLGNMSNNYQKYMLYWSLFQSCLSKRPYNLFHRKNLSIRTANVKRSFGNKATWDREFPIVFEKFTQEINKAIIDNKKQNFVFNQDVFNINVEADLIYIDPPYVPEKGSLTYYKDFYHFLEGIINYDDWDKKIDYNSKHKKLISEYSIWEDKNNITDAFYTLFKKFQDSILVISYRDDGIPSIDTLVQILKGFNKKVKIYEFDYKYALAKQRTKEIVLVAQ